MEIRLKKITLTNFKGVRDLSFDLSDRTIIGGDNGTGKTTIFDAFTWLLFGKDSHGSTMFNVKTLDQNNNAIPKIEHSVVAVIQCDSPDITISRTLREKWVKRRGEAEAEFTGNETVYTWNEVPISASEFKTKVEHICTENIFKLITDPMAFNRMPWKDQRSVLFQMAGDITNDAVLSDMVTEQNKDAIAGLAMILDSGKSFDEHKRETAAKKKKIREEMDMIPARIDETTRMKPQPVDAIEVNKKLNAITKKVEDIDKQLSDRAQREKVQGEKRAEKQKQVNDLNSKIAELNHTAEEAAKVANRDRDSKINELTGAINARQRSLSDNSGDIAKRKSVVKSLEKEITELREHYKDVNSSELKIIDNDICCPTCKRELDNAAERRDELTANFNRDKIAKLDEINVKGKGMSEKRESELEMIKNLDANGNAIVKAMEELQNEISEINKSPKVEPSYPAEINDIKKEIDAIEATIIAEVPQSDYELTSERRKLESEASSLRASLMTNDRIIEADKRIAELEANSKTMGQQIADLERSEFHINEFTKRKIGMVESRINAMFEIVRFKMYRTLINTGEEECCEAMVNGIPFLSDLNNAGRINAGLDIINALCRHFKVTAPVFIDNAESINDVRPTLGQQVLLMVNKNKTLQISN